LIKILKYLFLFFVVFFIPSLHAIPTVDITHLKTSKELFGPWAYAPNIIHSSDDIRLQKQLLHLPLFFESILGKSQGEATFTLQLKTTPNLPLSLDVKHPFTVWKLYANNQLIAESGKFGKLSHEHEADVFHKIVHFTPTTDTTVLIFHIANSQHQHIGFYGVPIIAPQGILEQHQLDLFTYELISIVLITLIGLYHIGLFVAWRGDKATLWFGLICLIVSVRATTTGEQIILDLFPSISWEMLLRIEYASGCLSLPIFVLYIGSLYPKHSSRLAEKIYIGLGLIFLALCTVFPTLFFTPYLLPYELIYVTFIFYTLYVLYRSIKAEEAGSLLAFTAFFILGVAIIHDLIRLQNMLPTSTDLVPFGFVFYLFAQASILLLRYANTFHLIEKHTNNLEQLVGERTKELSLLLSQRDLLLRELTHRVKNNLQFIVGLLWIQRKEADPQTNTALKTLESQIQSIAAVHESLCSQDTITTIEIHDYIRKLILSLKRLHSDLEISLDSHEPIYIQTDHTISLGLIINELITNHIKYSNSSESRPIHIFIEKLLENNVVLHYNDGIDHRETFKKTQTSSSFGLPKLGWSMIKEFVKQMDATISVYHDHLDLHFLACENI